MTPEDPFEDVRSEILRSVHRQEQSADFIEECRNRLLDPEALKLTTSLLKKLEDAMNAERPEPLTLAPGEYIPMWAILSQLFTVFHNDHINQKNRELLDQIKPEEPLQ